jgi:PncC family amidohydrolase
MQSLLEPAGRIGERLRSAGQTVAVAESSGGGLIAASLLAQPGASAYFLGGAVVYTVAARQALLGVTPSDMEGMRAATEDYALLLARRVCQRFGAIWGLAETGAAGPTGNRYGDPAGHSCFAVAGPVELVRTLETGANDRLANMRTFAAGALALLGEALEA